MLSANVKGLGILVVLEACGVVACIWRLLVFGITILVLGGLRQGKVGGLLVH